MKIVTRKIDGKWEGAVISKDGKLLRAFQEDDLYKTICRYIMPDLIGDHPEDTEIALDVFVQGPKQDASAA